MCPGSDPVGGAARVVCAVMERLFCFRFDVDTHRCIREGVPNLVVLGGRLGAQFTFFVNMGRLTLRRQAAADLLGSLTGRGAGASVESAVHKLPLRRKLGTRGYLEVIAANPMVGSGANAQIQSAAAAGHEIGLHGGRNHRSWQAGAPHWSPARIRREVSWGLRRLHATGVARPEGFSSPGWSRSPAVDLVLSDFFAYAADRHGGAAGGPIPGPGPIAQLSTNIVGEPGGVGYLEWHRAQGHGDAEVVADFRSRLAAAGRFAVAYDHPFWAGIDDLALTERLVATARDEGFRVAPLREIAAAANAS